MNDRARALRRLGVFNVGDVVVHVPDVSPHHIGDPFRGEGTVAERSPSGRLKIVYADSAWHWMMFGAPHRWVEPRLLHHQADVEK
jgi:hypothetical protein